VRTPGAATIQRAGQQFVDGVKTFSTIDAAAITTGDGKEFAGQYGRADSLLDFVGAKPSSPTSKYFSSIFSSSATAFSTSSERYFLTLIHHIGRDFASTSSWSVNSL
jgi:hypothetical protein